MDIASRIRSLAESAPLRISQRAAELRREGRDVIGLGAGEPDFPSPDVACRSAIEWIETGHVHYTAVAGMQELLEAVTARYEADQGVSRAPDEAMVSTGAKQAIFNALMALAEPGDRVLFPAPYWVSYPAMCSLLGLQPVPLTTRAEDGFKLDPSLLEAELRAGASVFLLNSPNNPTGAVYSRDELAAIGEVLARHDCWVITDEIYEKLVFDDHRHHSLPAVHPDLAKRTVVVNGVSKSYSMTGWRIGYALGPREAIAAMRKVQGHTTSNACTVAQRAALAALTADQGPIEKMRLRFSERRTRMLRGLGAIDGVELLPPGGAFYLFPDVHRWYAPEWLENGGSGSVALCKELLEEVGLALVPGSAFGDDRCVRVSYAASDAALDGALERLRRYSERRG